MAGATETDSGKEGQVLVSDYEVQVLEDQWWWALNCSWMVNARFLKMFSCIIQTFNSWKVWWWCVGISSTMSLLGLCTFWKILLINHIFHPIMANSGQSWYGINFATSQLVCCLFFYRNKIIVIKCKAKFHSLHCMYTKQTQYNNIFRLKIIWVIWENHTWCVNRMFKFNYYFSSWNKTEIKYKWWENPQTF